MSHFTSWRCCPLPWPTLTQTTAPLLACVCSGESPAPHNPQPRPTLNFSLYFCSSSASVHFSPTSLLVFFSSASAYVAPYFSLIPPCLRALFSFSVHSSAFPIHTFPGSFYSTITHLPWDQFTCAWPNLFPRAGLLCMLLLWSLLLLCLLSCHSRALHL